MATTSPARIDDSLYASAKLAGEVQSRSASQQVAHWARIGREIEASASIAYKDIADVLAGSRRYDELGPKEQAVVRAEWTARMDAIRESLNMAEQFAAVGRTWVELDADGNVTEGGGDGRADEREPPAARRRASRTSRTSKVTKADAAKKEKKKKKVVTRSGADKEVETPRPQGRGVRTRTVG